MFTCNDPKCPCREAIDHANLIKSREPFLVGKLNGALDLLRESHARETEINRQNFDLKNQNARLREAVSDAVVILAGYTTLHDLQVREISLSGRLKKVLRAENNI